MTRSGGGFPVIYCCLMKYRDFAEREGFEPPEAFTPTVFKTAAIDHSATSPPQKYTNFIPFFFIPVFFYNYNILIHLQVIYGGFIFNK